MGLDEGLFKVLGAEDDGMQERCFQIIQTVGEPCFAGELRQQIGAPSNSRRVQGELA